MTPKSKIFQRRPSAAVAETAPTPSANASSTPTASGDTSRATSIRSAFSVPAKLPNCEIEGEYAREARAIYSSTIGVEINHIYAPERRRWIYERWNRRSGFRVTEEDPAAHSRPAHPRRHLRAGHAAALSRQQALLARRRHRADPAGRRNSRHRLAQLGAIELVMGMSHRGRLNVIAHVAQRPPQEIFAGFEDVDPAQRSRLRRREISHGRDRRIHHAQRRQSSHPSGFESQPPRSRRSRHGRPHPRQAGPHRRRRTRKISSAPGSRRRRIRRTRHPRRNHELRRPSRLHRRRHDSRHRQQSARIHHQLPRRALHALRRLHRAPPVDSHLSRQRRRRRRRRPRRPHGHRIPLQVRHRRRHRPDRLSPPRPQRSRRSHHHAAAALQEDQRASAALGNLRRRHRRDRRASASRRHQSRIRSRAEKSRQHQARSR